MVVSFSIGAAPESVADRAPDRQEDDPFWCSSIGWRAIGESRNILWCGGFASLEILWLTREDEIRKGIRRPDGFFGDAGSPYGQRETDETPTRPESSGIPRSVN